jgi:hypothetical protein
MLVCKSQDQTHIRLDNKRFTMQRLALSCLKLLSAAAGMRGSGMNGIRILARGSISSQRLFQQAAKKLISVSHSHRAHRLD